MDEISISETGLASFIRGESKPEEFEASARSQTAAVFTAFEQEWGRANGLDL